MPGILRAAIVIVSLALMPAAFVACNSSGKLSLEDYFTELEKLDDEQTKAQDDLDEEYADKLNPTEFSDQVVDDFVAYFKDARAAAQTFVDDLEDLDPPDEAADAHDGAVEAFKNCIEETGKVVDDMADAQSFDDLSAIFDNEDVADACDATTTSCEELQTIADDNDINASLDCGD